jgi:molybdenum cofactor cytidylyltransferase
LYKGKTLVQHAVEVAVGTGIRPVVLVSGANADVMAKEITAHNIDIVFNKDWKEGLATSIRCGLASLLVIAPAISAVIMMVCDQPFVTTKLLNLLLENYLETGKAIVASCYGKTMGTPVLFDKSIFAQLLQLQGDTGAKGILNNDPALVAAVDFPLGNIDIDTETDYQQLLQKV